MPKKESDGRVYMFKFKHCRKNETLGHRSRSSLRPGSHSSYNA